MTQSERVLMLAIWVCQRGATKYFKGKCKSFRLHTEEKHAGLRFLRARVRASFISMKL
jgi:hypothetical protein